MKKFIAVAILAICLILISAFIVRVDAKALNELRIEGLLITNPEIVRDAVVLESGQEFTPADVQESLRRLYGLGLFRDIDIVIDEETETSVTLSLRLVEFPMLDKIEFEGNRKIKKKALEEARVLNLHQPFSDAQLHRSRQVIEEMYAEKGYLLAEIVPQVINTSVPGNAIVKYAINEGPRVRVRTVTFKGNENVKDSWLTRRFKTKENRWWRSGDFNEELYRAHLDTLMMHYRDQGFLDAAIEHDSIWHSEDKRDIHIEVTVNEGRRYYVGDIAFTGNRIIESDTLETKISMARGRHFRISHFEKTRWQIETAYREEGYLWVRVEDRRIYRGENADTIDIVFEITEGRPAMVRKVDIRGNSKTWEKVVRREIRLMPGQRYRQSLMALSQQNIFRLNYFTNIVPDIIPNDDGTIDIVFDITERDNIGQLTVGAAYSDQDGLTGTFGTAIPNFRGAGQELKLDVQYGQYRKLGMISFTEPWAFDTPLWLTGTVFIDQQIFNHYQGSRDTSTSYGFRVGVGRSRLRWPDNKFRFQTIYQLSHEEIRRGVRTGDDANWYTGNVGALQVAETGWLSRVRFNIERYDLDMPMFPNEGSRLTITPEIAGLGGDFRYLKGTVSYENYFRLPAKLVFGSEIKFGAITKLAGDLIISNNDLFTGGGAYGDAVIRGYPDWAFGGYRNWRLGDGISMFATNLSLRYPIVDQQVYVGAFMDMGNTWPKISGIDLGDLYRGVGAGIRIQLPMIGVMGVDVGYGLDPIDKKGFGNAPHGYNWHIIMNKGF